MSYLDKKGFDVPFKATGGNIHMAQRIRISQCMIVKNEEKNIKRALSWGKDIMSEQIVVDTGSTDRTVEIAKQMGAKVFQFPWVDDFSAAKNYAIDRAKGNWIIFLDADEYMSPKDVQKIPSMLREINPTSHTALVTSWVQVNSDADLSQDQAEGSLKWVPTVTTDGSQHMSLSGSVMRIFRRLPELRYQGRIHEKLYLKFDKPDSLDVSKELAVFHTGYNPVEMKEKDKVARNIHLIKKELDDRPDDYSLLTCLADSYFEQKNHEEAAQWYEKAADSLPEGLDEDNIQGPMIFKHLLLIYLNRPNEAAAQKTYSRGTKYFPKDADYDYLMGQYYVNQGNYQEAVRYIQKALMLLDQYGSNFRSTLMAHNLLEAWEYLIKCFYENGDLQQCVSCAVTLLKSNAYLSGILKLLLSAFRKDEEQKKDGALGQAASPTQVKAFLMNIYDLNETKDRAFVLDGAKNAEYEGLIKEIG